MVKISPQEAAQKWVNRLSAAIEDIRRGVQRLAENPCEKAAAKRDKWLAELQRAAQEGRWEAALRTVSLDAWKADMLNKGVPRIPDGARAAQAKLAAVYEPLFRHIEEGQRRVAAMPDTTLEQRIQRMVEFIRHMSQFRKPGPAAGR
jgi:hypothetical protein